MSYKTILLIASNEQTLQAQLNVATKLAARIEAHLVGLAVLPPRITIPAGAPGSPDTFSIETHRDIFRREVDRMRALFERATSGSRPHSSEWICDDAEDAPALSLITAHCHAADIVIASSSQNARRGPGGRGSSDSHLSGRLVVHAGRPVLLVPKVNAGPDFGERIVVAWNGTREASRAAFDAIPLLQGARHVKLLRITVDPKPPRTHRLSAAKLCGTLARHGIRPESEDIFLSDSDVGPALMSAVKAENADLLVMGCYGHSRLREFVFGGATRHVLEHMTVPVLMSH